MTYLPLDDIPHLFLVLYDFRIVPGLQLVEVFNLFLQHTQRFSERLQIYRERYEHRTDPTDLVYCFSLLRSFRFMFRISVSRMI